MEITSRTPNRIDLAGGTLDIYPLYLFEGGSVTVNAAIQIYSTVNLQPRDDGEVHVRSEDLQAKIFFKSLDECTFNNEMELLVRAVRHYAPAVGINLASKNEAPRGSGLGASSALLMATSAVLNELGGNPLSMEQMIDIGANLEAQTIRIPTGKQDYLAAMHGGLNAFWFKESGILREPILYSEKEVKEFEDRLILSYTGIPHFSGENNWTIMRRYIDGELSTVRALSQIKNTALKMREAVFQRNWDKIGEALNEEWENRKALAIGVTTPVVEHFMAKAHEAGAVASKLCGAGGGGCMITWVHPDLKKQVSSVLKQEGVELLNCKVALEGLQLHKNSP